MSYQLRVASAAIKKHKGAAASLAIVAAIATTATDAQAGDLPVKIPVDYVKICKEYGPNFIYVPSLPGLAGVGGTCLRIGGFARSDSYTGNTTRGSDIGVINSGLKPGQSVQAKNQVAETVRADFQFDARTATDWGVLRSYLEFRGDFGTNSNVGNVNSPAGSITGVPTFTFDRAFIDLAGFHVGRDETQYNFLINTNIFFQFEAFSEYWVNQFAYTAQLGNGFTATVSVEDPTTGGTQKSNATAGGLTVSRKSGLSFVYGGLDVPDIIGALKVSQAWGAAQLSVGYHQLYETSSTSLGNVLCSAGPCSGNGYGVQAGVNFNVPLFGPGSKWGVQAAYAVGATGLAYSWGYQGAGTFASADLGADAAVANGVLQLSKEWTIASALEAHITPTIEFDLVPSYYVYSNQNAAGPLNYKAFEVGTQIKWTPFGNQSLAIYTDFEYRHINVSASTVAVGNASFRSADAYIADLRLKRNF
jgi:hypothetical protein